MFRILLVTTISLSMWSWTAAQDRQPEPLPDANPESVSDAAALTLEEIQTLAFQHNPTLAIAAARTQSAQGRQIQAGLYPNPVVGYHATEVGNLGTQGVQGGFVSQRFITGGKRQLDQSIAGKQKDEASFRYQSQQQRVLSDIRIRFYETLAAQHKLELTEKLTRIADNLVEATETLLSSRQRSENDLLQAQIQADEAHILLENARNEYAEAWRRMMAVVGTSTAQVSAVSGHLQADLPDLGWEECYGMILSGNPEVSAAQTRVERARIAIQRSKKEVVPDVDVFVSARHNNITGSDVANIQVGVPLPIFDRNQGNIRSAEAEWVAACQEVQRLRLELEDRLASTFRRYANARQQAQRYSEQMLPRAERSLSLVTNAYEKGQVEYLTLLTSQQTYLTVSLNYIDSLRELRTASATIEGQLLTNSLTSLREQSVQTTDKKRVYSRRN